MAIVAINFYLHNLWRHWLLDALLLARVECDPVMPWGCYGDATVGTFIARVFLPLTG